MANAVLVEKITELKERLILESTIVESMIAKTIRGLLEGESGFLREVVNDNEKQVDSLELEIDEICTNALALYQPEAKELRTVLTGMKMNSDMERMADSVVNMAESAMVLIKRPQLKPLIDIPRMAEETRFMLNDAIKAFVDGDVTFAKGVIERDDIVDSYNEQIFRELITYMISDTTSIKRSMHLIRVANNLERIADLSTNIAGNTIYMIEGKVVRHEHNFQ